MTHKALWPGQQPPLQPHPGPSPRIRLIHCPGLPHTLSSLLQGGASTHTWLLARTLTLSLFLFTQFTTTDPQARSGPLVKGSLTGSCSFPPEDIQWHHSLINGPLPSRTGPFLRAGGRAVSTHHCPPRADHSAWHTAVLRRKSLMKARDFLRKKSTH